MRFDGQRVFAEQPARHPIVQHGLYGFGAVIRFAVADESGVGVDAHQQQVGEQVERLHGFDRSYGDFAFVNGGRGQVGFCRHLISLL